MTDLSVSDTAPRADSNQMVLAIYVLHLLGFFTLFTPIVALVLAYVQKSGSQGWQASHYDNAIHIFWKGLFYTIACLGIIFASIPLFDDDNILGGIVLVLIGAGASLAQMIWFIVRCAKGIQGATTRTPYADPESWGF